MKNFNRSEKFLIKLQSLSLYIPAWLVFLLCLGLTSVTTYYSYTRYTAEQQGRFDRLARTLYNSIENRFSFYNTSLTHVRSLFEIAPNIDVQKFNRFVESLNINEKYPGLYGIGYLPKIDHSEIPAFEKEMSKKVQENFRVSTYKDSDGKSLQMHFPMTYFHPMNPTIRNFMGFDPYSQLDRKEAMDRAIQTGKPSATAQIELKTKADEAPEKGFVVFLPIFKRDAPISTPEERSAAIEGFIFSSYKSKIVFNFLSELNEQRKNQVSIQIYEGSFEESEDLDVSKLLFSTKEESFEHNKLTEIFYRPIERRATIDVGNYNWTILFKSLPEFLPEGIYQGPMYAFIFGIIVSILISLLIALSRKQGQMLMKDIRLRQKAEQELQEEQKIVELSSNIGLKFKAESDLKDIVQMVTDTATQLTKAKFGAFFYNTVNTEGEILTLYTLSGAPPEAFAKFPMPRKTQIFGPTFEGQGIVRSDDITKDERYGKMGSPHHGMPKGHLPVRSYLASSVKSVKTGEVLGGLFFGHPEPGIFTEKSEKVLEAITAQAAVAMDNAKLYTKLREAQEAAEDANRAKSNFLANMSHEIRTPLGIILGYADLAIEQKKKSPENLDEYLISIKRNGEELTRIIGEVLDLSKIEANKLELEKIKFNLPGFLDDVLSFLNLKAREKGISLSLNKEASLPEEIVTDPTRLRQIITNLVGNAIKFTEKGTVTLFVRLNPNGSDEYNLNFAIEDTGIGISKEQKAKLFKPFSQADNSTTRKYGGSGLGLLLSRELAKAMGGNLDLEWSELQKGSRFQFNIIAYPSQVIATAEKRSFSATQSTNANLESKKILVAEDSEDNQFLIKHYLKTLNADVAVASNGTEAINLVESFDPDLILMDIQMPVLDGYAATYELRRTGFDKPIIALTAHALNEEKERALRSGFDDYLTKPLDKNQLLHTLQRFLTSV